MGKMILLTTPIGNISDITDRVRDALTQGKIFIVEDTRSFKDLLNHLNISLENKKIFSWFDHSTELDKQKIMQVLETEDVYLCSEAGSPLISDPAYPLIQECLKRNISFTSYPGVSSLIVAAELSGLRPNPMSFHGFLPRDKSQRLRMLKSLDKGTHYFFESPKRVETFLDELNEVYSDISIAVLRELTKKFESVYRFNINQWDDFRNQIMYKGEFVIGIEIKEDKTQEDDELINLSQDILKNGATPKQVAKLLSKILNLPTKEIYQKIVKN